MNTAFEALVAKGIAGTLTMDEALGARWTDKQRELLLSFFDDVSSVGIETAINQKGDTWGGATTLPTSKKPIHSTVTGATTITMTSPIWYSIYLISNGTITETNGSTITTSADGQGKLEAPSRVDGQAYPSVTFTVPASLVVDYAYLPL